jgi:hypothetical protein
MVINLMDAFVSGSSSRAAWEAAVASAKAAEAREGG